MSPASDPTVPRRNLPGGGPSVSLLGIVVGGNDGGVQGTAMVERLRRARTAGVTTFDLARGDRPDRGLWLLSQAFPDPDDALTVIVADSAEGESSAHPRTTTGVPPGAAPGPAPRPIRPNRELGWTVIREMNEAENRRAALSSPPTNPAPTGTSGPVALHVDPASDRLPEGANGNLYSASFSLLEHRVVSLVERSARPDTVRLLARDPFAGGRLDGSRFSGNWLERGPSAAPASLRTLAADFEPVLRLAFLTSARERTLAQAALQYLGAHAWVSSILVPLPPADRMEEILASFTRPPLTPADLARVDQVHSA